MSFDPGQTADLILTANRLKVTPRTGWAVRGVPDFESVADHSHGVAFVALLLCDLVPGEFDRAKVLTMAILHDLPIESRADRQGLRIARRLLVPHQERQGHRLRELRRAAKATIDRVEVPAQPGHRPRQQTSVQRLVPA